MKVTMLKNHMGFKKGEVVEEKDALCRYWIGCGVAKKAGPKAKSTKDGKPKTEKK